MKILYIKLTEQKLVFHHLHTGAKCPSAEWYNERTREVRQRVIKKNGGKCSFKKSKLTGRTLFVKTGVVLTYNEC